MNLLPACAYRYTFAWKSEQREVVYNSLNTLDFIILLITFVAIVSINQIFSVKSTTKNIAVNEKHFTSDYSFRLNYFPKTRLWKNHSFKVKVDRTQDSLRAEQPKTMDSMQSPETHNLFN